MSRDRCHSCGVGRYAKIENMPDEYLNDLRSRAYQEKLHGLKRRYANGEINRVMFLAMKNELDRKYPNPKVNWGRLPESYKTVHALGDEYDDTPAVTIKVPHVREIDDNHIGISLQDMELVDKDGKTNTQKVAELRADSKKLLDDKLEA